MLSRKRKSDYGGFTFVELIVAVSVVATLAVVGIAYGNNYKSEHNNAVRLSDVQTLVLAADSYFQVKGDYPEPTGNRIYFDSLGAYSHSATGSYGVSSSATSDLFGSEFFADVPRDPDTGNAYGYGKRKDGTAGYDIAAVDRRHDGYYAYVRGKYDASSLSSLVREYNGPGFVEDGKSGRLPYNPTESKITAKISTYGWAVTIKPGKTLTEELSEGDTIHVPAGGYAVLHVSDGTEARIGAVNIATELKLENLNSKDSKRFLTRVRFALNGGEVWTKAPKLREDRGESSEIEIVSGTVVASVRGTVFWIRRENSQTNVTLAVGEIQLETASGNDISWSALPNGILKVEEVDNLSTPQDETLPKSVTITETLEDSGNNDDTNVFLESVTENSAAREQLKEWEGAEKRETKPKSIKLSRDASGNYSLSFRNDSGFSSVSVETLGGESQFLVATPSGIVKITLTGLSTSSLKGYPENASTQYKRFPFRFESPNGASAAGELVIPSSGAFELDENTLPKWIATHCAIGNRWYWKLGCQSTLLVAYAPYDQDKDLYAYDYRGEPLGNVVTNLVVDKDHKGNAYKKNFDRLSLASNLGWAATYSTFGLRGIGLDLYQGDDYVGYDFSSLGIRTEKIFRIEISVTGRSLKRKFSDIDEEMPPESNLTSTNPPYNSSERRAYLWAMEDGTSLYLKAANDENTSLDQGTLVLTGKDGTIKSTWTFNRSAIKNEDRVSVVTQMGWLTSFGTPASHSVSLFIEGVSIPLGKSFSADNGATYRPERFRRIWIGSSAPTLRSASGQTLFRWHSQWAGKKSTSTINGNWTGEIIDFVKIFATR